MFILIYQDSNNACVFCGIYTTEKLARERLLYICKNIDLSLDERDFLLFNSDINENIFQHENNHGAGRLI